MKLHKTTFIAASVSMLALAACGGSGSGGSGGGNTPVSPSGPTATSEIVDSNLGSEGIVVASSVGDLTAEDGNTVVNGYNLTQSIYLDGEEIDNASAHYIIINDNNYGVAGATSDETTAIAIASMNYDSDFGDAFPTTASASGFDSIAITDIGYAVTTATAGEAISSTTVSSASSNSGTMDINVNAGSFVATFGDVELTNGTVSGYDLSATATMGGSTGSAEGIFGFTSDLSNFETGGVFVGDNGSDEAFAGIWGLTGGMSATAE